MHKLSEKCSNVISTITWILHRGSGILPSFFFENESRFARFTGMKEIFLINWPRLNISLCYSLNMKCHSQTCVRILSLQLLVLFGEVMTSSEHIGPRSLRTDLCRLYPLLVPAQSLCSLPTMMWEASHHVLLAPSAPTHLPHKYRQKPSENQEPK